MQLPRCSEPLSFACSVIISPCMVLTSFTQSLLYSYSEHSRFNGDCIIRHGLFTVKKAKQIKCSKLILTGINEEEINGFGIVYQSDFQLGSAFGEDETGRTVLMEIAFNSVVS